MALELLELQIQKWHGFPGEILVFTTQQRPTVPRGPRERKRVPAQDDAIVVRPRGLEVERSADDGNWKQKQPCSRGSWVELVQRWHIHRHVDQRTIESPGVVLHVTPWEFRRHTLAPRGRVGNSHRGPREHVTLRGRTDDKPRERISAGDVPRCAMDAGSACRDDDDIDPRGGDNSAGKWSKRHQTSHRPR